MTAATTPTMKFKLLRGQHNRKDPNNPKLRIKYRAGDIIESKTDLARKFGSRYQRVIEDVPSVSQAAQAGFNTIYAAQPNESPEKTIAALRAKANELEAQLKNPKNLQKTGAVDTLTNMKLEELRKFAQDEEIDLKNAKTRDEVLAIIRAAI